MRRFAAGVAFTLLGAVAGAAQEPGAVGKGPPPDEPAPRFFAVTEIGNDNIKFTELAVKNGRRVIFDYVPALAETEIYDAAGKKVTPQQCRQRVRVGAVVVVAAEPRLPAAAYRAVLKPDTLVIVPRGVLDDGQTAPPKK